MSKIFNMNPTLLSLHSQNAQAQGGRAGPREGCGDQATAGAKGAGGMLRARRALDVEAGLPPHRQRWLRQRVRGRALAPPREALRRRCLPSRGGDGGGAREHQHQHQHQQQHRHQHFPE